MFLQPRLSQPSPPQPGSHAHTPDTTSRGRRARERHARCTHVAPRSEGGQRHDRARRAHAAVLARRRARALEQSRPEAGVALARAVGAALAVERALARALARRARPRARRARRRAWTRRRRHPPATPGGGAGPALKLRPQSSSSKTSPSPFASAARGSSAFWRFALLRLACLCACARARARTPRLGLARAARAAPGLRRRRRTQAVRDESQRLASRPRAPPCSSVPTWKIT